MKPANVLIDKFGGPAGLATAAGVHISRVHRWTYPKERGGTDGLIPQKHHQTLMEKAEAMGISLTPADFFPIAKPSTKGATR